MILHERRCIFVHIPRTGGTSIEDTIWGWPRRLDHLWMGRIDQFRNKYQTDGLQHLLAWHIREEVGPEAFDNYFKFTMVRNPFDKIISEYHFMKDRPDLRWLIDMEEDAPFEKYVSLIQKVPHVHWEPQHSFILHPETGKPMVDFVGRYENFDADFRKILVRVGLPDAVIPHLHKTNRRPYQDYYTPETRATVQAMFQRDLTLLGYSFD